MPTVLEEIRDTLRAMNAKTSSSPSATRVFEGSLAADLAKSSLRSAVGSAPNVADTLSSHVDLLTGAIGSDRAMVDQVVNMTSLVNRLRDAWHGAGQEVRTMSVNSLAAVAGMAAIVNLGSRSAGFIGSAVSRTAAWPTTAMDSLGETMKWGPSGSAWSGTANGMRATAWTGLAQGAGIAGAGLAANAAFGESYVGDAMVTGGSAMMAYRGSRMLLGTRAMSSLIPGAAHPAIAAMLAAGTIYATLPRGKNMDDSMTSGDPAVDDTKRSLGYANEYPFAIAGLSRSIRSNARGEDYERAMKTAGITPKKSGFQELMEGNILGSVTQPFRRLYGRLRNWSQEEMEDVAAATHSPTYRPPSQNQRDLHKLEIGLNFQSRQMDIGDLHGFVQGETMRTPLDQQRFENLVTSIDNLRKSIDAANGGGSSPSSPRPPS